MWTPVRRGPLGLLLLAVCWIAATLVFPSGSLGLGEQVQQAATAPAQRVSRQNGPDRTAQKALQAGFSFYQHDQYAAAKAQFEQALALAKRNNDSAAEADAHRGLGIVLLQQARYDAARKELEQALAQCQAASHSLCAAHARQALGQLSQATGDWKTARELYRLALAEYELRKDVHGQASVLRDLNHNPSLSIEKRKQNIQRGLALARQSDDKRLQGGFLEDWGDALFTQGDYAGAIEKLEEAETCFEQVGDRFSLARVLTSEGRIYRAHGIPAQALEFYERALKIQQEIGDGFGTVQSMNAIAIAYDLMGQQEKSLAEYEAALALARKTGSPRLIAFILGNLAGEHLAMKRYTAAAEGLEEALAQEKSPYLRAYRYGQLSQADFALGHYEAAVESANNALRLGAADSDEIFRILYWRAKAEQKLGRSDAALTDVKASLKILGQIRHQLVPSDFMKQGFTDWSQFLFDFAITLYHQQGNDAQALAISEEGRARAFEDLLASRDVSPKSGTREAVAAAGELGAQATSTASSRQTRKTTPLRLTLRGAQQPSATVPGQAVAEPDLQSFVSSEPFSIRQIEALAARDHATILSYWVGTHATFIWVVKPDGTIHSARVHVSATRLEKLIRDLWPRSQLEEKNRGGEDPENVSKAVNPHAARLEELIGRGGYELTFGSDDKKNWRELYTLLIQPVEQYLPSTNGSLLTIEPHGPLLLLPFAALIDEHGRYLIERYSLNYTPSLSLFQYVDQHYENSARLAPHFLFVADPTHLAPSPNGERLPALPGAREEVARVARMLPAREVTVLVGRQAQEQRVEGDLSDDTVIHFATHAILENRSPSGSYLALGEDGAPVPDAGRLTAADVYSLRLHANLVFLSACRTGMGKVSGDGIVGLTRAFFYAGASSVVASLWDVSDETTVRLVPDFYRFWLKDHNKAEALREAQLHLMRNLRAGRVKIHTPYGTYVLPEDPVLWASFILEGKP